MSRYSCRATTVIPGERCWFWGRDGDVGEMGDGTVPTLRDGWTFSYPARYNANQSWNYQWAWQLTVASDEEAGSYDIAVPTAGENVTVTVVAAPTARPVRYANTPNWQSIQNWLLDGYDIELAPRVYEADCPLIVPANARIFSPGGAKIVRVAQGSNPQSVPDTGVLHIFRPKGNMTLEGLTLDYDPNIPDPYTGHTIIRWGTKHGSELSDGPSTTANITVRDCVIRRGNLGASYGSLYNVLVERCVFDECSTGIISRNAVYLNNRFIGHTRHSIHACFISDPQGVLLASNTWERTNRGIVCQSNTGYGVMSLDNHFCSIRGGENNANEVILIEGGTSGGNIDPTGTNGWYDCTFIDTFISDCVGPGVSIYGTGMHDIQSTNNGKGWWEVDSIAISLVALNGGGIDNCKFSNVSTNGIAYLVGDIGAYSLINTQFYEHGPLGLSAAVIPSLANVQANTGKFPVYADADAIADGTPTFSSVGVVSNRSGVYAVTAPSAVSNGVSTTDDTPTTILTVPIQDGYAASITVSVFGIGADGNSGTLKIVVRAKRASETVTVQNVTDITTDDAPPGSWDLTATNSGTNVIVQVTGELANVINWRIEEFSISETVVPT